MKSNFKKFAVAIAAIMTLGSVTLVSCDKEDVNKISISSSKSTNNPYSFVGELHNTTMYDLGRRFRIVLITTLILENWLLAKKKDLHL